MSIRDRYTEEEMLVIPKAEYEELIKENESMGDNGIALSTENIELREIIVHAFELLNESSLHLASEVLRKAVTRFGMTE